MIEKLEEKTFIDVAKTGNLSIVAANRGLTREAIGQRISRYEQRVGLKLFTGNYKKNYGKLTYCGKELLKELTDGS